MYFRYGNFSVHIPILLFFPLALIFNSIFLTTNFPFQRILLLIYNAALPHLFLSQTVYILQNLCFTKFLKSLKHLTRCLLLVFLICPFFHRNNNTSILNFSIFHLISQQEKKLYTVLIIVSRQPQSTSLLQKKCRLLLLSCSLSIPIHTEDFLT